MHHGTVLDERLEQRAGSKSVLVIDYCERPEMAPQDNDEIFHNEASIMWSLSFHPNIVGLLAFTEQPRAIIMRYCPWDLPRFLAETPRPMRASDIVGICGDIAQAVNATHTMGVAHRNIQTASFYVVSSSESEPPVVQLGHFSEARTEYALIFF